MVDTFGASRFLAQASLGADLETIELTAQTSFPTWIDNQINNSCAVIHI